MPQVKWPKPKKPAWTQKDSRAPIHNTGGYTPAPPGGAGYIPPGYGPQPKPVQMPGAPTSTQGGGGYYTGQTWHTSNYGPYQSPQGYYVGHYPTPQAQPPATGSGTASTGSGASSGWGSGWGGWGGGGGGGGSARDVAAWAALVAWNINR